MFKVALFGFGRIGQLHAKNIHKDKNFELSYVYEKSQKLALKAKKNYNCQISDNYNKIFNDEKIDIIFIASPTSTHINLIEKGIYKRKIIFCEKPIDLNIEKVKKTLKKIVKLKPKIQMGFNRRYDPGHNDIKNMLDKKKIGKLEKIIITSRDPSAPPVSYLKSSGGIFRDMMIHDFDMCRYFLKNDEIKQISAFSSSFNNKYNKINDHELACVTMKSKNGVLCSITNSRHCSFGYDQRIELFGSKGMLISGNKRSIETEYFVNNQTSSKKRLFNFFIDRYKEAYELELKELFLLAKKKKTPRSTFIDGYEALKLANAAVKSLSTKRTVFLSK